MLNLIITMEKIHQTSSLDEKVSYLLSQKVLYIATFLKVTDTISYKGEIRCKVLAFNNRKPLHTKSLARFYRHCTVSH